MDCAQVAQGPAFRNSLATLLAQTKLLVEEKECSIERSVDSIAQARNFISLCEANIAHVERGDPRQCQNVEFNTFITGMMRDSITCTRNFIAKCEESIAGCQVERHLHVRRLEHYMSVSAPISRVPFEVLGIIFTMYAQDDNGPFAPLVLSAVSRLWRSTALRMPSVWSKIEINVTGISRGRPIRHLNSLMPINPSYFLPPPPPPPPPFCTLPAPKFGLSRVADAIAWTNRAGITPLDLTVHLTPAPMPSSSYPFSHSPTTQEETLIREEWLKFIKSLRPRWRSLKILSPLDRVASMFTFHELRSLLDGPAPLLESMELPHCRPPSFEVPHHPLQHNGNQVPIPVMAPRLSTLRVGSLTSSLDITSLKRLTTLSFSDGLTTTRMNMTVFRNISRLLQFSFTLRNLTLNSLTPDALPTNSFSFDLPELLELHVISEFPQTFGLIPLHQRLFSGLHIPKLETLRIVMPQQMTSPVRNPQVRHGSYAGLKFLSEVSNPPLRNLELHNVPDVDIPLQWYLEHCPDLTTLCLRSTHAPLTLAALTKPAPWTGGYVWLCPHLQTIELWAHHPELVPALIASRHTNIPQRIFGPDQLRSLRWDGVEYIPGESSGSTVG